MRFLALAFAVVVVLGVGIIAFIPQSAMPTQEELESAEENVITPCYYHCGPWYTWFEMIFVYVGLAAVAIAVVQRFQKDTEPD